MKRVVIVGGGITGLSVAHALGHEGARRHVTLLEGSDRLGGNIRTVRHNGMVIDAGPDSWIATKPEAAELAREVGLDGDLIGTRPDTRRVYVAHGRELHPLPDGLVLGIPTELGPWITTPILSWDAKLRAGLDVVVPRRTFQPGEDESVASFLSRRLGDEVVTRVAGPLLGGIFAGDPSSLSVRACAPQLVDAEQTFGSLILAMRERRRAASSRGDASLFLSLKRGLGDLVVHLAHKLGDADVRTETKVESIERLDPQDERGRFVVVTDRGPFFAHDLVVAGGAHAGATLLGGIDAELARTCEEIEYVSTATIFLAFKRLDVRHPLDGVGFLVPRSEGRPILAATFVSSKWEHRAPSGQVLLRVFVGGAGNEAIVDRDDAELVDVACGELRTYLGIEKAPMFAKVFRFHKASPQPYVGHVERVERILGLTARTEGLYLGGSGLAGTGIPDAIRQGRAIAAKLVSAS